MMQSQRNRRSWRLFFGLSLGAMLISAWFGYNQRADMPWRGVLVGIVASLVIGTPIILVEVKGQRTLLRRLRRLPLLAYLGLKIVFYVIVILGGLILVRSLNISSHEGLDDSFGASVIFSVAM